MSLSKAAAAKKVVSVSPVTVTFLTEAGRLLGIHIPEEVDSNAYLLCQKMWELQQEAKEKTARRKLDEEIEKLEREKAELALKLADKGVVEPDAEEGEEVVDPKLVAKRRAEALKEEVKGMKKKLPKRAPTEWSAFKHEHRGEKLSPAGMSELYKATSKEEKKEILARYKEYLASKAEESE